MKERLSATLKHLREAWYALSGNHAMNSAKPHQIKETLTVASPDPMSPPDMNASTFRTKLTRDIQSRVAKDLGLSRSHVSLVANGKRQSSKVTKALAQEYARIEIEVARVERKGERAI